LQNKSLVTIGNQYISPDGATWKTTNLTLPPYPPAPPTPSGCYGRAEVGTLSSSWGAGSDIFVVGITYSYAYCCPPPGWNQCDHPPRAKTIVYTSSQVVTGPSFSNLYVKKITGLPQTVDSGFVIGGNPNQVLLFYMDSDGTIHAYSSASLASEFMPINVKGLNKDGIGNLNWIHNRYFACGRICFSSLDGINWTPIVTFQEDYPTIRWSGRSFTATSMSKVKSFPYSTSSDGVTWQGESFPVSNTNINAIAFQESSPSYRFAIDSSVGGLWMKYTG